MAGITDLQTMSAVNTWWSITWDNFDIQILSKLLNNCRESDRQIGIDLGMSGGAVNARIRKMQKLEIIEEFYIVVEPPVLGYGILYFVISDLS